MKQRPYRGEVIGRPALEVARGFQTAKQRISLQLGRIHPVKAAKPIDTTYFLTGQRLGLDEWELRLLLKVYRPVRGLVRWVKKFYERGSF